MISPITFPSALWFWLTYGNETPLKPLAILPSIQNIDQEQKRFLIQTADSLNIPMPLHIMVPNAAARHKGKEVVCSVMPRNLPEGSIIPINRSISVICPELCFLLAANYLGVSELAVLACDLCGIYARNDKNEYGQIRREPVTSVRKISDFLQKSDNISGVKKARIAISFALDGSNSPMESRIAVVSNLKPMYGGYGLPKALLNEEVFLSMEAAAFLKRKSCCCDMFWKEQKTILEYDSDLAHHSQSQIRYDKKRATALGLSGYSVMSVTADHFRNFNSVENLFIILRKNLGVRSNPKCNSSHIEKRYEVVKKFFLTTNAMNWLEWIKDIS